MGRRTLRKIDSSLDLSWHFIESAAELPEVWDPVALFGRGAPLEIDVGCGKGMFLASAATAHPEHNFLGIEITRKYARFAAAKLAEADSANARVLHGDAILLFREKLPAESVTAVHVYFPDPWWKMRHRKRRIMSPDFIHEMQRVLVRGGTFHFWTDVREYYDASCQLLGNEASLAGPFPVPEPVEAEASQWRTHFDRRMQLSDEPVFRADFRKATAT